MDVDDTLTAVGATNAESGAEPYSASWWQTRSTEELRTLINGGFGSAAFEGASLEAERRGRESMKVEDELVQAETVRKKRLRLVILEGVLLASLIALIVAVLLR